MRTSLLLRRFILTYVRTHGSSIYHIIFTRTYIDTYSTVLDQVLPVLPSPLPVRYHTLSTVPVPSRSVPYFTVLCIFFKKRVLVTYGRLTYVPYEAFAGGGASVLRCSPIFCPAVHFYPIVHTYVPFIGVQWKKNPK